jgi:glutathione S-transferase
MYTLFYYPRNASWAPHLILEELGVEFKLERVDRTQNAHKSKEYIRLNPTGRIPTLIAGEQAIFESAAIGLFLCEQHPDAELIPQEPIARARCYQWLLYLCSSVQSELMVYFYPQRHVPEGEASINLKSVQQARITEMYALLDQEIGDSEFLLGDRISICDYFLFMLCHWASGFNKRPVDFPNLGRVLRSLARRPAFIKVAEIEGTPLDMYKGDKHEPAN